MPISDHRKARNSNGNRQGRTSSPNGQHETLDKICLTPPPKTQIGRSILFQNHTTATSCHDTLDIMTLSTTLAIAATGGRDDEDDCDYDEHNDDDDDNNTLLIHQLYSNIIM